MKIAVLGSGGWGTALAMLLEENGHQVTLWSYLEQESKQLQATGGKPPAAGVKLPAGLSYTWDLDCVVGSDVVVMATPSFGVRSTAEQIAGRLSPGTVLVSVSKGIEKGTFLRMSQIIREATGDRFPAVTLSGPSHAEEVARKVPTAVVSASPDRAAAEQVQDLFLNDHFRVYSSSDVVGVELGAALKNVMALCTGLLHRHGVWGQYQGHAHDPGPGGDGPPGGGPGGPAGDLRRPGRDGGPHRHLHLHELSELPGRHSHRPRGPRSGSHCKDRCRGGGVLRRGRRPRPEPEGGQHGSPFR